MLIGQEDNLDPLAIGNRLRAAVERPREHLFRIRAGATCAAVLADNDSGASMMGGFDLVLATSKSEPEIRDRFGKPPREFEQLDPARLPDGWTRKPSAPHIDATPPQLRRCPPVDAPIFR